MYGARWRCQGNIICFWLEVFYDTTFYEILALVG